jgi:sigma54-dependent transcription regulator
MKKMVAIGLLGPVLDQGAGRKRWERWRPTVAVCQHEDLLIGRFGSSTRGDTAALWRRSWKISGMSHPRPR